MEILKSALEVIWPEWVLRTLGLIATWAAARYLIRSLGGWVEEINSRGRKYHLEARELRLLDQIVDTAVAIGATLISISLLKLTGVLSGLLTAAGVVGIAVGFTAQDIISNFISGLFVLMDQTFVVGDVVEIGSYSGTVQKVSLRTTTLTTFDGTVVTVPNSNLATTALVNYSTAERRRIRQDFTVLADQDVAALAREIIIERAKAGPNIWEDPVPNVYVNNVKDGAVNLMLICYAAPGEFFQAGSDLRADVVQALAEANIQLGSQVLKTL